MAKRDAREAVSTPGGFDFHLSQCYPLMSFTNQLIMSKYFLRDALYHQTKSGLFHNTENHVEKVV